MRTLPLVESVTVTLDGSGNGTAFLTPAVGQSWSVALASVNTSSAVLVPNCKIYLGHISSQAFIDGTIFGSLNSTDSLANIPIGPGTKIISVWTGGDAGASATLTLRGTKEVP